MLNALFIDPENKKTVALDQILSQYCPGVRIDREIHDLVGAQRIVENGKSQLIILDINSIDIEVFNFLNGLAQKSIEFIVLTDSKDLAYEAIKFCATSYVLKPINPFDLSLAIRNAQKRIKLREESQINKLLLERLTKRFGSDDLIGIPTMEGLDFLKIKDIIRCKGMTRCTNIVTSEKSNLVSSYNLGEFRKLLEPLGFFSPHKSHLININCIQKYSRDGSILMSDGFNVPVARRKRSDFLEIVRHI